VSHTLACPCGLSLTDLECNLNFQGKLVYPVSQTGWSGFGRFSLRKRRALVTEIGPTSTQVASGQGIMANLGASGGRD
jgi:hypothetical protein